MTPPVHQLTAMVQDFHSVHGESALFIARTFYKTTAVVKYAGGANGLPGADWQLCTCQVHAGAMSKLPHKPPRRC